MRKKDDLAIEKIIECAKTEFLEKGFEGASMRRVAENAGYTTGMLYGRFADKGELFKAIVKAPAEKLYSYYAEVQESFANLSPETQYKDFDGFKLIICTSKGSEYEKYIDSLIEIETENTLRFINDMNAAGIKVKSVRADLSHMLATAMFNGMFEVVEHDFSKDDARQYIKQLQYFFNAGWDKILGLPSDWTLPE